MLKNLQALWSDERGFIVSIELILIVTIGVLGLIVGLSCLASAVVAEYQDIGWAVRSLNQGYYFGGFRGCKSFVPGSSYFNGQSYNNYPIGTEGNWDLGLGNYGPGVAAPAVGAPVYVQPGAVVVPDDCPNCPVLEAPKKVTPCPGIDCQPEKILPGGTIYPQPELNLPQSTPAPKIEAPAPAANPPK